MPSPLRAGLATLLLLGSTAARAQTITLAFPGTPNLTTLNLGRNSGINDCNNQLIINWTATSLTSANTCNSLQVWITNGNACGDSPGTSGTDGGSDLVLGTFSLATQQSGQTGAITVSTIPGLSGVDCNSDIVDVKNAICASVQFRSTVGGNCSVISATPNLVVRFDSQPPDPPSLSLLPQDSKIVVNLAATGTQSADIISFNVEYQRQFEDGGVGPLMQVNQKIPSNSGSGQVIIEHLVNENTYQVRGYALDQVSNISAPSDFSTAVPEASDGFWATYKKDGGEEQGGCSAGGVEVPSAIAAAVALVALLRRRR